MPLLATDSLSPLGCLPRSRVRDEWSRDENLAPLLQKLDSYEAVAPEFVVNSLEPIEPFATMIHADLQPSNLFFKISPEGGTKLKVGQVGGHGGGVVSVPCMLIIFISRYSCITVNNLSTNCPPFLAFHPASVRSHLHLIILELPCLSLFPPRS